LVGDGQGFSQSRRCRQDPHHPDPGMYLGGRGPNMPTEARIIGADKTDARGIVARLREEGVVGQFAG